MSDRFQQRAIVGRERRRYLSYLLRLWQVMVGGELVWRASLESPHTRERWGFASLASLVAFLQGEMRDNTHDEGQPTDSEESKPTK